MGAVWNKIKLHFSSPGIELGRYVIIFGGDMSSSTKIDNRRKRYADPG